MERFAFFLDSVAPFRLDLTVWALRRRPDNIVDRWDGEVYRRVLPLPTGPVEIAVRQIGPAESPKIRVAVTGQQLDPHVKTVIASTVERLLGLHIDLAAFHRVASHQDKLGQLAQPFRGVKPPRLGSVFESVLNGIACQQMTLTVGIQLLNKLAKTYGLAHRVGDVTFHAFPRPEDLASLRSADLRQLGFSHQKGRAMIELSQSILEGRVNLEALAELSDEEAVERLRALRGIGRWTAEYVLLRGLGRTHVFPGDDVGARNNLQRWLELADPPDYEEIQQALVPWKRYGGLIYFHLLLTKLSTAGYLQSDRTRVALPP